MAADPALIDATKDGILIWAVLIAAFLGLYGVWKYRDGEPHEGVVSIAAAILIILIAWATDYYRGVWLGGTFLGISIMMRFTSHDEGNIQEMLFWTGAGLLAVAILGYLFPVVLPGGYAGYILAVTLIGAMLFVDINLDRYAHSWELMLVFAFGLGGGIFLNVVYGLDHAWHGLALMGSALLLVALGVYTKLVDPVFIAGFLIYVDDIVGHGTGHDPKPDSLLQIWFVLGFIMTSIYVIRRWREE